MGIRGDISAAIDRIVEYYVRNYKKMVFLPIAFIVFFSAFIGYYYYTHGQFFKEDISLAGGTSLSVNTHISVNPEQVSSLVSSSISAPVTVTVVRTPFSNTISGYSITTLSTVNETDLQDAVSSALGIPINSSDSSVTFISASLAQNQLYSSFILLGVAFVLVALVSLFYFRNAWQAFSNVVSIISDIINIIGVLDIIGFSFSTASIAGILMIMGYSADRNIILATNILKRKEATMKYRLVHTIKTSLTMDAAALATFLVLFFGTSNSTIHSIAIILIVGVIFDDFTVWILNGSTQLFGLKYKEANS